MDSQPVRTLEQARRARAKAKRAARQAHALPTRTLVHRRRRERAVRSTLDAFVESCRAYNKAKAEL